MTPQNIQNKLKKKPKKQKSVFKAKSKQKQYLRIKCPICYSFLETDNVVSTKCGHVYCKSCLDEALRTRPLCPLCRKKLVGIKYHYLYLGENVLNDECRQVDV